MAKLQIVSPVSGEAVPMSQVPDEVFAEGMAGEGVAVVPSGGVASAAFFDRPRLDLYR